MDRQKILLIGGGVLLLIFLGLGGFFLLNKDQPETAETVVVDQTRQNTLLLAEEYLERGEFQRALDLLDSLMIKNAGDEEARLLRDRILEARKLTS